MDKEHEFNIFILKCDDCGKRFKISVEPHAGVRDYFTCSCGKRYYFERGIIISSEETGKE